MYQPHELDALLAAHRLELLGALPGGGLELRALLQRILGRVLRRLALESCSLLQGLFLLCYNPCSGFRVPSLGFAFAI